MLSLHSYIFGGNRKPASWGFTLIELLVVIAIIGILSAIVIGSTSVARAKARDVARRSDMAVIQLALATYFDVNKAYPTVVAGGLAVLQTGGFISTIPTDPVTHAVYPYSYAGQKYCLGTILEDTTVGLPSDNSTCVLNTCTSPVNGATNVLCTYTVQK